jgi:zinc D-Ala-D-Ala carboxypeptidase
MTDTPRMLSIHFSYAEMTKTRDPIDNTPDADSLTRLTALCDTVLEPARALLAVPFMVDSGFRNKDVNAAAHGEAKSAHLEGRACDFIPAGIDIQKAFDAIRMSEIPYDKIILETKGLVRWIHIQINSDGEDPRKLDYVAIVDPITHVAHYEIVE